MRLADTGLTFQDIKDKVNTYMIETYERFDFLADHAKGVYMYDENGILLLLDEVQAGWGRCGALMSYMNYDVKPDIVSMAKALGSGMVINTAGVTLAHGMEHPVSGLKDAVHGVGLAAIEPACVEATCRYNRFKFGKVSRLIGGLTAEDCCRACGRCSSG